MEDLNPYESPQTHSLRIDPPIKHKRFGWPERMALVLWLFWTIGLLMGLVLAFRYVA